MLKGNDAWLTYVVGGTNMSQPALVLQTNIASVQVLEEGSRKISHPESNKRHTAWRGRGDDGLHHLVILRLRMPRNCLQFILSGVPCRKGLP